MTVMSKELSEGHVRSGKVMTVNGAIDADQLGITLMHEHILNDCRCWWNAPQTKERQYLAEGFVCMEILYAHARKGLGEEGGPIEGRTDAPASRHAA